MDPSTHNHGFKPPDPKERKSLDARQTAASLAVEDDGELQSARDLLQRQQEQPLVHKIQRYSYLDFVLDA